MDSFLRLLLFALTISFCVPVIAACNISDTGVDDTVDGDAGQEDAGQEDDADGGPLQCSVGETRCEVDDDGVCVDINADPDHCGGCNESCETDIAGASPHCDSGECRTECESSDHEICDSECIAVQTDPDHCGSCDNTCFTDSCTDGSCDPLPCSVDETPFGGGDGAEDDPHTICTIEHLNNLRSYSEVGSHFALSADIDLQGVEFEPIALFEGTLHGYGFAIANFSFSSTVADQVGFISQLHPEGEVRHLEMSQLNLHGDTRIGGLAGENFGLISDVTVDGDVSGSRYVGGLVGYHSDAGSIVDSTADVAVGAEDGQAGGLAGALNNYATIDDSIAHGSVTATDGDDVGGLVGAMYSESTINSSSAYGDVAGGHRNIGGLVGEMRESAAVNASHAFGDVESSDDGVGGLAGRINDETHIEASSASGEVTTSRNTAGGLVGEAANYSVIEESFSTGQVRVDDKLAGGLVGRLDGTISDSYATGDVSDGEQHIGGLVGGLNQGASIFNSYSSGLVTGDDHDIGGLVGTTQLLTENVESSYWDIDTSGQSDGNAGIGLRTEEFADQGKFEDWDFDTLWLMPDGDDLDTDQTIRPRLQWEFE